MAPVSTRPAFSAPYLGSTETLNRLTCCDRPHRFHSLLTGIAFAVRNATKGNPAHFLVSSRKRKAGLPVISLLVKEGHQYFSTWLMTKSVPSK